jgi:hypothetical protein
LRAALIYQHATRGRERRIADGLSAQIKASRIGHVRGTSEEMPRDKIH